MKQKIIGKLIKEYRNSNNLSLREFAEKTSFSHTFISNLEKNYNPSTKKAPVLTFEMLDELAKILGYSLNELINILQSDTIVQVNKKSKNFKNRLKEAIEFSGISQADLSKKSGIAEPSISNYLSGGYEAGSKNLKKLAEALSVNPIWLMGEEVDMKINNEEDIIKVPLFVAISENKFGKVLDYKYLPKERLSGNYTDYFLYKINSDNMAPKYLEGDILLFKYNNIPKNNKDVLVTLNNNEAMFSQVSIKENSITLNKYNPFYESITYTKDEIKKLNIKIVAEVQSLEYRDLRR